MVKMEQLFLFGTGKVSEKYTKYLEQVLVKIDGYIDNNAAKQGKFFHDKLIYGYDILRKVKNSKVLIACADHKAVTQQLIQLNMQDKIVSLHSLVMNCKILELESEKIYLKYSDSEKNKTQFVIMDNLEGTWGGAEDWVHKIALSLLERNYNVIMVENICQTCMEEPLKQHTLFLKKDEPDMHFRLIEELMQRRPFVLFNIWNLNLLWAASYIKKKFPADVKIVSVLLNDVKSLYQEQQVWNQSIDRYLCISNRIKNNLTDMYSIEKQKVYCRIPFVECKNIIERKYNVTRDKALVIAYPCRLVQGQKRADMLPAFITEMEKRKINYILNIVGDGACKEEIQIYVEKKGLDDKVFLWGKLSRDDLLCFLNKQDIYLNFSEHEGMSLTMLESMARGCVPVVTNVSGVEDVIINRKNGFVSEIGDLEEMADNILFLDKNRAMLDKCGKQCKEIIYKKCDIDDYMDHIENVIEIDVR